MNLANWNKRIYKTMMAHLLVADYVPKSFGKRSESKADQRLKANVGLVFQKDGPKILGFLLKRCKRNSAIELSLCK